MFQTKLTAKENIKKDDEYKNIEKRRNGEHSFDSSQFLALREP